MIKLTRTLSVALLLSVWPAAFAAQLRLSDGTPGGTIVITDQGSGDLSPLPGYIVYVGPVGSLWNVDLAVGISQPEGGGPAIPYMDIDTSSSSVMAGTLTIALTDTGFTGAGTVAAAFGGTSAGTVTFTTWAGLANGLFETNKLLTTIGPLKGNPSFSSTASSTFQASSPYSLTLVTTINHSGAGRTGFDASMTVTPPPQVTIGDYVWNDLNGNGVQDASEPGIPNVTLTLTGTDAVGNAITQATTTDQNGFYQFTEPPGTYTVAVTTPTGYLPTVTGKGTPATDSNLSPSGTTPAFLPGGSSDQTLDFGFYLPVSIGNFVWNDLNGNGVQDANEPGIPNVTLTLTGTDAVGNAITQATTTDQNGFYQFTEPPGTYTVAVMTPTGYLPTVTGKGTPATDSNPSPSGTTPAFLPGGSSDQTLDFGFYLPVSIGNFVWNDLNGNGVQDANEPGIPNVALTLTGTDAVGNAITQATTTDQNGFYQFTEPPGTYTVAVMTPTGYLPTATGKGTPATDSNPSPSGTTPAFLPGGSSDQTLDFGFYLPVSIGNFVWNDLNGNGVQDANEPGIPNVTLTLTGTDAVGDVITQTTTTDQNGFYQFTELPGTYTVAVTAPAGYLPTATGKGTPATDSNPSPSGTTPAFLPGGSTDQTLDFGFYQPVSIGNFVWNDLNGNGVQDANEPGIPNVTLTLTGTDAVGNLITQTTTTDQNGFYQFTELPGTYTVAVTAPAGYLPTATGKGTPATDSNPSPSGTTPAFLPGGSTDQTLDFGFYQPVSIGNFVWNDLNGNGVQDANEPGIPNVTLTLTGTDGAGNAITQATTTDQNGSYQFTEPPGTYTVAVTAPTGYVPTAAGKGTPATDSNPSPSGTTPETLPSGSSDQTLDFGFYKLVTIGDFVWNDLNGNGVQDANEPGIPNVTLTLTGTDGAGNSITQTTTTDQSGFYQFTELPGTYTVAVTAPAGYLPTVTGKGTPATDSNPSPSGTTPAFLPGGSTDQTLDFGFYQPVSIGNFVWNDLNGNGVQDVNEPGIPNVTLTLTGTDGAGNSITQTTTTDQSGFYQFTEPPGTYAVAVTAPAGYLPTVTGKGTLATDSNPSPSGTTPASLPGGSSDQSLDFGFFLPASLGDYVWIDTNQNGIQDDGQTGLSGVLVTLYKLDTCGGSPSLIGVQTTVNGNYLFQGLAPGIYQVKFVLPANYSFTAMDQGTDNAKDSDADKTTGMTACITLISGQVDKTWDAGVIPCPPGIALTKKPVSDVVPPGGIAGYVYEVVNTGCSTLTDVQVYDDYGTPNYTGDDILVGTVQSLAPGAKQTFTSTVHLPMTLCGELAGGTTDAGTLITQLLPDGNIRVIFIQSTNRNDNTYGDNSIGWKPNRPHRFKDLVNSDHVQLSMTDSTGKEVLKFNVDYITAASGFPSGYGCLGVTGGDGGMLVGSASAVLGASSSLAENLNNNPWTPTELKQYTVDSPALTDPNSAKWEYRMIYEVVVSGSAFGSAGFGSVRVSDQHNSPPKNGLESFTPVNCGSCVTNVAVVYAASGSTWLTNTASAKVCSTAQTPQGQIGDFVWLDTNMNGAQDAGEPGVGGVTVQLWNCGGNLLRTTKTAADGSYLFSNLSAGSYMVKFVLPSGYSYTTPNATTDDKDSDADVTTGSTPCITLAAGEQNLTIDAGLKRNVNSACLGDFVWLDMNGNGLQDEGEPGAGGVKVELLDYATGTVLQTMNTATDGSYLFSNLPAGSYQVRFTPPSGYIFTLANQSLNDEVDSDANPLTGITPCVTLVVGERNLSVDAGLVHVRLNFTTFTQGGWGAPPHGNNPGTLLVNNFSSLYGSGGLVVNSKLKFTSAGAVQNFLPAGGTPGILASTYTDPRSTPAGVFAGQVLALRLNVDFSNLGLLPVGLGNLKLASGQMFAGQKLSDVLLWCEQALGGDFSHCQGYSVSQLNDLCDRLNNNFDGGIDDNGVLVP